MYCTYRCIYEYLNTRKIKINLTQLHLTKSNDDDGGAPHRIIIKLTIANECNIYVYV